MKKFMVGGFFKPVVCLLVFGLCSVFCTAQGNDPGDYRTTINANGTINITKYTGYSPTGKVVIPKEINKRPVVAIGDNAFDNAQLTSITIPNSVTTIGKYAFQNNKLTSVTIPNSVTTILGDAFRNNKLTSVTIPDSVRGIENGAFANNQLTSVTIPDSVRGIGNTSTGLGAFANNRLTSVIIPDSVREIGLEAFANNQLTSVTIPDSVRRIGRAAFINNQLISITIGENVNLMGYAINGHHVNVFDNFDSYYDSNGKKAGTYTWDAWDGTPDWDGTQWSRK
jgi:hypothetical protein